MKTKSIVLFFLLNLVLAAGLFAQTSKTYTDMKNGFSFKYASDFALAFGSKAKLETAMGDPGLGVKLLSVSPKRIPEKYHGTYEFNIWRSKDTEGKCSAPAEGENLSIPIQGPDEGKPKTIEIGGHTFYAYTGQEGGMSKSLTLTAYRGVVGGRCWQI